MLTLVAAINHPNGFGDVHLTEVVIYLSLVLKSSAVQSNSESKEGCEGINNEPVPLQIRNTSTKLIKDLDSGNYC
ncbi:hypothetical protein [Lentibacillus sp. Marseille-P4043]|uniref:AAA family ATPase n=1 Tax=Lentibacillus sp. Marseille-P4043 TaxID=2040293 RepID=UPI00131A5F03|nr:hypothetical protein [Lentibacillus sp. Marseille-P4043]